MSLLNTFLQLKTKAHAVQLSGRKNIFEKAGVKKKVKILFSMPKEQ